MQNQWKFDIFNHMTFHDIERAFEGKVIGSERLKHFVYQTLTVFPDDIALFISKYCWFMGSMDDAYAYAFTGNDLKDQHLIFLSDDLLIQSDQQIQFTVAHEIGHIILNHKNSVEYRQTREEISEQEKQADEFAHQYGFFV